MIKFDFIKKTDNDYLSYNVKVNGIEYEDSTRFDYGGQISLSFYAYEVCNIIENERNRDLLKEVDNITLPLQRKYAPETIEINDLARVSIKKDGEEYTLDAEFEYNYEFWARGYTIPDIVKKLEEVNIKNDAISFSLCDQEDVLNGFKFSKAVQSNDNILNNEITIFMKELKGIFKEAAEFIRYYNKDKIYYEFGIDKSIKVAFKQYLIYFTQFLEDIGIESDSVIKDNEMNIIFEVIPKDKTVALNNIRKCLEIYLRLIDNKELALYEDYTNVAVMQLKANIDHLNTQLMLFKTIAEQRQITIDLLKSGNLVLLEKEKSEVTLLNGAIKVKEFEWKGLSINPAKIINLLKRK